MADLSKKVQEALLAATTAEEATAALAEDGIQLSEAEAEKALNEARTRAARANAGEGDAELSPDELAAVAGGGDLDWLTQGCAATVEPGSWCWSDDACSVADVTYDNAPAKGQCKECGGTLYYEGPSWASYRYSRCRRCGAYQSSGTSPNSNTQVSFY